MKGLLLKDLYTLKSFAKQYGLIFGAMIIWSYFMKSSSFLIGYAVVLSSMLVLSSMSMDENVSFNRYALTMPLSCKSVVKAKYLLLILTTGCGVLFGVLFHLIMTMAIWKSGWEDAGSGAVAILGIITVCIIGNTVTLPIMFRYNAEKARYVYIVVMLGVTLLVTGIAKVLDMAGVPIEVVESLPFVWLIVGMIIICLLALLLSYWTSLKMAEKKAW